MIIIGYDLASDDLSAIYGFSVEKIPMIEGFQLPGSLGLYITAMTGSRFNSLMQDAQSIPKYNLKNTAGLGKPFLTAKIY